jgi:hypothetical protein
MTLVKNMLPHPYQPTSGPAIAPGAQADINVGGSQEQDALAIGALLIMDGSAGLATDLQELLNLASNAGRRYVELQPDHIYVNTGGMVQVPSGTPGKPFELIGHNSTVTLRNLAGQPAARMLGHSRAEDVHWILSGYTSPGLGGDPSAGAVPVEMYSHSEMERCSYEGLWAMVLIEDHITLDRVRALNVAHAMVRIGGASTGNLHTRRCDFTGATTSGHFVAWGTQEDSWTDVDSHFGFAPFCLLGEPNASQHEFAYTNVNLIGTSFESWGNRALGLGTRKMSGVMTQPRSGKWDLGGGSSGPAYFWSGSPWMADHNYAVESGNLGGWDPASNENLLMILTSGGDEFNGAFIGGGATGVFLNH